jgi:hypothetical protein
MSKAYGQEAESDCATPCRQLDTLADIRTEMARIYRLGTSRQIAPRQAPETQARQLLRVLLLWH